MTQALAPLPACIFAAGKHYPPQRLLFSSFAPSLPAHHPPLFFAGMAFYVFMIIIIIIVIFIIVAIIIIIIFSSFV